ncbi:hypothetical protein EV121DRAFT_271985 [Schizophyllum commune]
MQWYLEALLDEYRISRGARLSPSRRARIGPSREGDHLEALERGTLLVASRRLGQCKREDERNGRGTSITIASADRNNACAEGTTTVRACIVPGPLGTWKTPLGTWKIPLGTRRGGESVPPESVTSSQESDASSGAAEFGEAPLSLVGSRKLAGNKGAVTVAHLIPYAQRRRDRAARTSEPGATSEAHGSTKDIGKSDENTGATREA